MGRSADRLRGVETRRKRRVPSGRGRSRARLALEKSEEEEGGFFSNLFSTVKNAIEVGGGVVNELAYDFIEGIPGAFGSAEKSLALLMEPPDPVVLDFDGNKFDLSKPLLTIGGKSLQEHAADLMHKAADADLNATAEAKARRPVIDHGSFEANIRDPLWIARNVGDTLPNMFISFGVGAAVTTVSGGAMLPAVLATFGTSSLLEGGFAYEEAIKSGATEDQAEKSAGITGVINGVLETIPFMAFMNKLPLKGSLKKAITGRISGVITQIITEGGTEAIQEVVSNAVARTYDEERYLFAGVKESAFIGGILGAGAGVVAPSVRGDILAEISEATTPEDAETAMVDAGVPPDVAKNNAQEAADATNEAQAEVVITKVAKEAQTGIVAPQEGTVAQEESAVAPELQPLAEEARKFDTAEEFVASQKEARLKDQVSRGAIKQFESVESVKERTSSIRIREKYTDEQIQIAIDEVGTKMTTSGFRGSKTKIEMVDVVSVIRSLEGKTLEESTLPARGLSDKQLTTIFNQAKAEPAQTQAPIEGVAPVPVDEPQETQKKAGNVKYISTLSIPKVAMRVRQRAIQNKVLFAFETSLADLPETENVDKPEQARKATDFTLNNPEVAIGMALEGKPPPEGILSSAIFISVVEMAEEVGDTQLNMDLAQKSVMPARFKGLGQEISQLSELNPESSFSGIQKVNRARNKRLDARAKKEKTTTKAQKKKEIKKMKEEIRRVRVKSKPITREKIDDFIKKLEC